MEHTCFNNLVDLAIEQAKKYDDKPLYQFLGSNNCLKYNISFAQLDKAARQWAALLKNNNIDSGERALILIGHEPNYITAFWGCLYAGVIAVPVFPPKGNKSGEINRLITIAEDCQPAIILTTDQFISAAKQLQNVQPISIRLACEVSHQTTDSLIPISPAENTIAFLQYTSGSTGTPKGVIVDHMNLMTNEAAISARFRATSDDILFSWLPFYHDMGLIGCIIQSLYSGITAVLISPIQFMQSPLNWLRGASEYKATLIVGPNFSYDYCCDKINNSNLQGIDLSRLRMLVNGAEPIRANTMERFTHHFWQTGLKPNLFTPSYGLAEATLFVSCHRANTALQLLEVSQKALQQHQVKKPINNKDVLTLVSNGAVINGHEVAIVSPNTNVRCKEGSVGEILISGPSVSRGYWQQTQINKRIFECTLDNSTQCFMRTGDYGFLQDGELFITGRAKELIIIRGRNFYPQDLEKTIEQQVDYIQPARVAAFSVNESTRERLIIVAEPSKKGIKLKDFKIISQYCALAISSTLGISADEIIIARLGTITKTSSGKTQRNRCKSKYLNNDIKTYATFVRQFQPPPKLENVDCSNEHNCIEFLVQQISTVTGIDIALLDKNLPLLALGLDSLHIAELIKKIQFHTGENVAIEQMLSEITIEQLAQKIVADNSVQKRQGVPNLPYLASTEVEQSFQQQRLWFLQQMNPKAAAHNIVVGMQISHEVDFKRLCLSFTTIAQRHNILRTVFTANRGKPIQKVLEDMPLSISIEHTVSDEEYNQKIRQHLQTLSGYLFNLNQGPLWKSQLVSHSQYKYYLIIAFHHIIFDGISANIFCQELANQYSGVKNSPTLQYQYQDYAQWQKQQVEQKQWQEQLEYWQKTLYQSQATTLDKTSVTNTGNQISTNSIAFNVSKETQLNINHFAKQHQLTPFMVLLGAFYTTLHYQTGKTDITIGTDTANRPLYEWQYQLGFFVNQLALRVQIDPYQNINEFYNNVRKQTLAAYQHQSFPFDQLVSVLNPIREGKKTPFFSTKLVWQRIELDALQNSELAIDEFYIKQSATEFDLVLDFVESSKGLSASFTFNPVNVSVEQVERFSQLYSLALGVLLCNNQLSIHQIKQRLSQSDITHLRSQSKIKPITKTRRRHLAIPT